MVLDGSASISPQGQQTGEHTHTLTPTVTLKSLHTHTGPEGESGRSSVPDTGMEKEQRGQRTVSWSPGSGRMFPHSGQKFRSDVKQDISARTTTNY